MKIVFLGTPDFAAYIFSKLLESGRHKVLAAVTQPDRPRDRGRVTPSPVKELAQKHNIPVLQYERISREGAEGLRQLAPDIMVTAAYGQILSQEIIDIPTHGIINVHASLLPAYRGAAPIQWAVIRGETGTGVSIMQTEAGLDCGPVILTERVAIGETETAGQLFERLMPVGADALIKALDLIETGRAEYKPQDESRATHFPPLRKTDGEINWGKTAREIFDLIRGVNPWPGAYTYMGDAPLKIWSAEIAEEDGAGKNPGEVIRSGKDGVFVQCGKGILKLSDIQASGAKRMAAADFIKGRPIPSGTVFCGQL